jgi:hypothetical protein
MNILVDVKTGVIQLGERRLKGQWVDFYALLAIARSAEAAADPPVTADVLARTGPWRHKAAASVGKEVARHLSWLCRNGLGEVVESHGRTRSWRLRVDPAAIRFEPDRSAVEAWIEAQSQSEGRDSGWADGLKKLLEATVEIQRGRAELAIDLLSSVPDRVGGSEPALQAWRALLCGKARAQADEHEELYNLIDEWSSRSDAAGRAVGARLRAVAAFRHRFQEPAATLASLVKLAAELELRGDIGSLAVVLNVMGLLARRSGHPDAGMAHHLRAAALFGIAGDYPSLQGALFNVSICRKEVLEREGQPPDEQTLSFVDMTRLICASFGVGRDSSQAETAGAEWALEMGDVARARGYLKEAEELIKTLESTVDQAYFLEVRAALELADPTGGSDPAQDLRSAERLYETAGDLESANRVARARRRLISGIGRRRDAA